MDKTLTVEIALKDGLDQFGADILLAQSILMQRPVLLHLEFLWIFLEPSARAE